MIKIEDKYGRLDEFEEILNEIYKEIPEKYLEGLNLGIVIEEEIKYHPEAINNDLYVMGTYNFGPLGRGISIYYGSFMRMYGYLPREILKKRVKSTLLHEITHHRESLAKVRDLEIEDKIFIDSYKEKFEEKN